LFAGHDLGAANGKPVRDPFTFFVISNSSVLGETEACLWHETEYRSILAMSVVG
jgi:hypothetical protein